MKLLGILCVQNDREAMDFFFRSVRVQLYQTLCQFKWQPTIHLFSIGCDHYYNSFNASWFLLLFVGQAAVVS